MNEQQVSLCLKCRKKKLVACFGKHKTRGVQAYCKKCMNEYNQGYHKRNQRKRNNDTARRTYNLDVGSPLLDLRYTGSCEVCGVAAANTPDKVLRIDHDHITKEVRGLLCHPCNASLGLMKENPTALRNLAEYIEKHRS